MAYHNILSMMTFSMTTLSITALETVVLSVTNKPIMLRVVAPFFFIVMSNKHWVNNGIFLMHPKLFIILYHSTSLPFRGYFKIPRLLSFSLY